jgi:hypothetical protein
VHFSEVIPRDKPMKDIPSENSPFCRQANPSPINPLEPIRGNPGFSIANSRSRVQMALNVF